MNSQDNKNTLSSNDDPIKFLEDFLNPCLTKLNYLETILNDKLQKLETNIERIEMRLDDAINVINTNIDNISR
jgi:hypothetical protein